jgi:hypothetical protein
MKFLGAGGATDAHCTGWSKRADILELYVRCAARVESSKPVAGATMKPSKEFDDLMMAQAAIRLWLDRNPGRQDVPQDLIDELKRTDEIYTKSRERVRNGICFNR